MIVSNTQFYFYKLKIYKNGGHKIPQINKASVVGNRYYLISNGTSQF